MHLLPTLLPALLLTPPGPLSKGLPPPLLLLLLPLLFCSSCNAKGFRRGLGI